MLNRLLLLTFLISGAFSASAQQASVNLNLQQCIEMAVTQNVEVKQQVLQVDAAKVNYRQSKANLLPSLNSSIYHGMNEGRSIDPFTNGYVDQQINYASYVIGSSLVLFNGSNLRNSIRSNAYAMDASKMELQQVKDNVTINTMLAYLQVLNNEDQVELAKAQVIVVQKQLERLDVLNSQGAINPPLVHELTGQLKNNELSLVTMKNALESSKLNLAQVLNIPYSPEMKLERLSLEESLSPYKSTAQDILEKVSGQMAFVKAAALRTKSAESNYKAIRGLLYPTLALNGSYNTNYSSAARMDVLLNTSEAPTNNYVLVNGSKIPVVAKQSNYSSEKISYNSQLRNNVFSNFSLSLQVPLFNSLQVRNRMKLARIQVRNSQVLEENVMLQLRQQVNQAYINLTSAWERYKTLLDGEKAYAEAFRAAEVRFNSGVGTSIDYIIAKNNLDRTQMALLTAKYDYVLYRKVLDYYINYNL